MENKTYELWKNWLIDQSINTHEASRRCAQAKRDELEAMLQEKDRQLEAMRAQLESGQSGGADVEERSLEQRRKAEEANTRECQAKAAKHVEELKAYMQTHNLYNANPTGRCLFSGIFFQRAAVTLQSSFYQQTTVVI